MVKRFFTAGQFLLPPPQKVQNEHIIGMVTPLAIPIYPSARPHTGLRGLAVGFLSNIIMVTSCVRGSLFEVH